MEHAQIVAEHDVPDLRGQGAPLGPARLLFLAIGLCVVAFVGCLLALEAHAAIHRNDLPGWLDRAVHRDNKPDEMPAWLKKK